MKFDIIIIGSGLGGLICGAILSKEGYRVGIIEKHFQIGGCIQTFKRDGCVFDVGGHYVGGIEKGQNLYQFFKYLGIIDDLKLSKLDINCFDKVVLNQSDEYNYGQGYNNFIDQLSVKFPDKKRELNQYLKKIREISGSFPLYNLKTVDKPLIESFTHTETLIDSLSKITNNQKLINVLFGTNSLYVGIKHKSPFYIHALINNSYIESAYRFIDGSSQIADLLVKKITANGGEIIKNAEVTSFEFDEKKISNVVINNNEKIFASTFISNIHPVKTLKLIPPDKIRKIYRSRINSLDNTIGMFTVYIVLKKNTFKYINHNIYLYRGENVFTSETYDLAKFPEHCMILTPKSSSSEIYAESMIIMSYMKYDEFKTWENTNIEQRGNDYEQFKSKKIEEIISFVSSYFPSLKSSIYKTYSSSPLTYRDYTGTENGSLYGIERNANDAVKTIIFPKTYITNLFLTGQNINLHGILGVTVGAILTSAELTNLNYLINKINKA